MLYYYMKSNLLTPTKPFFCKFVESFQVFKMAKSKYEYVKKFETEDQILPNCWIVVRIDGRAFHKFTDKHNFAKPNDIRALDLMNRAAMVVMSEFKDILISYGQSDEYSFILRKDTELYNRRSSKIMTYINSLFSSSYVFHWGRYFGDVKLKYPPAFDSRLVLYPSDDNLKDYLSWRQADCHVNNLYNTTFWALVLKGGLTNFEAEKRLSGTVSSDKNEILFNEFSTNYNDEPVIFKKGTILLRKRVKHPEHNKTRQIILPLHEDLIQDKFWNEHWEILRIKSSQFYELPSKDTLALDHLIREQLHIKNTFVDGNEG